MKALLIVIVVASLSVVCFAQSRGQQTITNKDIVELVKAQFAVDTVIKRVQTAASVNFDTSTSALVELKKAGVDEKIIVAMLERSKDSPERNPERDAPPAADAREAGRGNDPKDAAAKTVAVAQNEPAKKKSVRAGSFTFDLGGCRA